MGARGPKADPAQAAKGFPGRRKSKAEKAAEESARLAKLLAPGEGGLVPLPVLLQDPKYAPAAALWKRLAPELRRTHRLPIEAEFYFAQLCIYGQEWVTATEDLHGPKGFSQSIATVAGGKMERRRPVTFDRQQAFSNLQLLSGRFGMTPMDMYDLFKGQALAAATNPGLFGEDRKGEQPAAPEPTNGRLGGLSAMRSTPPPVAKPN